MARVRAILGALWTALRRDRKSLGSFSSNNLFLLSVVFLFLKDPEVFVSINVFIGVVLFLPLSADPLRKIPPARLALWPLARREHRLLRLVSPWFNPVTWLLVGLALWRSVTLGLWAVVAGLFAVGFAAPSLTGGKGAFRRLPDFPGPLNELVRKNLREMLSTLDFYAALAISVGAFIFRALNLLPAEARLPLTLLVTLAISTYAQSLFGLDGDGGMTRYRLLPVPGRQILAAKDLAYLPAAFVLTLPLAPLAGLAAAMAALAVGHHASVRQPRQETRWRFSTGASFFQSLLQMVLMAMAGAAVNDFPWLLAAVFAAYAGSTWWFGGELERQPRH